MLFVAIGCLILFMAMWLVFAFAVDNVRQGLICTIAVLAVGSSVVGGVALIALGLKIMAAT